MNKGPVENKKMTNSKRNNISLEKITTVSIDDSTASQQIDTIIISCNDWRGKALSQLRSVIREADSSIIEEVKWKKPSKPEGVAVWSSTGIICVADILKNAVRLTFPKGARIADRWNYFNARLDSKVVRAVDYHQNDPISSSPLSLIVREAVQLNVLQKKENEHLILGKWSIYSSLANLCRENLKNSSCFIVGCESIRSN